MKSQMTQTVRSVVVLMSLISFTAYAEGVTMFGVLSSALNVSASPEEEGVAITYQVEAQDEPLHWVIRKLRDKYSIRICWEEMPKDEVADRITASDMVRELTEIQSQKELSSAQASRLKYAQEDVDKGEGNAGFGWKDYRIQGVYQADTIPQLLDLLMEEGPYGWYEENGTYVVLPRQGSQLEYNMSIKVENALLSDVFQLVAEASPPSNRLIWAGIAWGSAGMIDKGELEYIMEKHANQTVPYLHMEDVPAMDVLNRAVEATGGHVTWVLTGVKKTLIYRTLPSEINRWKTEYQNTNGKK